jgi:hypothetical protein
VQEAVEARHALDAGARQLQRTCDRRDRLRPDPAFRLLGLAQDLHQLRARPAVPLEDRIEPALPVG